MDTRKCIDCLNDNIIRYVEIKPCHHLICYNCISLKLLKKSISFYLDKNTKLFIFKCLKCPNQYTSLEYDQIDSILAETTQSDSKRKEETKKDVHCLTHKSKYDYYCHSCKISICQDCTSNDHKYHQWIMIKEYKQKLSQVSSNWLYKSYKELELSIKKHTDIVTQRMQDNYNLLNTKITNAINELKAYATKFADEKEKKLKEMKYLTEIIKKIYKKYYRDIEEIHLKDINEVKYLSKLKYEYCQMNFKPFSYIQINNRNKTNEDLVSFSQLKSSCICYSFTKLKKVAITFSSNIRIIKECLNIINTKNSVGTVLFLNENEIYFSSGSFSSDSKDKNIQIYNIKQRKFDLIETHHSNSILCLCQINNQRIASGSYDNTIKLWNIVARKEEGTLIGHKGSITTLQLWKTDILISGSNDCFIKVWDLANMNCIHSYSAQNEGVFCLYIVDNVIYCGGEEKDIKILSINEKNDGNTKGYSINQMGILKGHSNIIFVICGNQGKVKHIASGSKDSSIRIWKKSTMKCIGVLSGHNYYITDLTYLLDNRLASSSKDKTIRIWNMNTMSCDIVLQAQEGPILSLSLLNDGRLLSGFKNNMIRIWG